MEIRETTNASGLPRVEWTQEMTGGTLGNTLFKVFAAVGAAVGAGIGLYSGGLMGLAIGAGIGAMGGLWFMSLGAPKNPRDQEAMQRPLLKDVPAMAEVIAARGGYSFHWKFAQPSGQVVDETIPLGDFETFESGSSSDWFAGSHERGDYHDMFVIVLHSVSHGAMCVAAHAGSRAEVSRLHAALTRQFVIGRRALATASQATASGPAGWQQVRPKDGTPTSL